jgi:putative modified peptide
MSNTLLPRDQGEALMRKLAGDDAFRQRFQDDPASALAEIGIDPSTVDAGCCKPRKLAAKEVFAGLLKDMQGDEFTAAMSMHVHKLD